VAAWGRQQINRRSHNSAPARSWGRFPFCGKGTGGSRIRASDMLEALASIHSAIRDTKVGNSSVTRLGKVCPSLGRNRRGVRTRYASPARIGKGKGERKIPFSPLYPTLCAQCEIASGPSSAIDSFAAGHELRFLLFPQPRDMALEVVGCMVCLYRGAVSAIVSRCDLMPANSRAALSACVVGSSNPLLPPAHAWTKK
jgi:hypothetical protein